MSPESETLHPSGTVAGESSRPARAIRRGPEWALIVVFLAVIASVPLIQFVVETVRGDRPGVLDVFNEKPTAAHLRAYEKSLEGASVAAEQLRPWIQFAQFNWLRDGGDKALIGRDGWLFYKPGFDAILMSRFDRDQTTKTNDPLPAIVRFRDDLAARGIQLLVVVAPDKESVYPDMLTRRVALRRAESPLTKDLLERLRAAHVELVDLFKLFAEARKDPSLGGASLYLTQDSHWSPAGVQLAAQTVARRLFELGWLSPGSAEYEDKPAPVKRIGDVLHMLQAPLIERRAEPELVPCVQVVELPGRHLYKDSPKSEVLVLGDSFLRIYQQDEPSSAGFIAHLAKELKQPLASIVSDGGASTLVRQELHRRAPLLNGRKVVVWEFVERDIRLGTEGWQVIPLHPARAVNGNGSANEQP